MRDSSMRKPKRFALEQGGPISWGLPLLCSILLGIALGAASERADYVPTLGALTSYLGIWIISTFLVGRFSPKWNIAIASGVLYLLSMIFSYYALRTFMGSGDQTSFLVFWTAIALTVGPLLSIAGNWTRDPGRRRFWSISLVSGFLLGEAISVVLFRVAPERWFVVFFDIIAAIFVFSFLKNKGEKKVFLAWIAPFVAIGMLAFQGPSLLTPIFEVIFW